MNTLTLFFRPTILISLVLSVQSLCATSLEEISADEIDIQNSGRVLKTISAKLFVRKDLQWIAIRVNRRDFAIFPSYSHLHIELYDESGKLLKTDYRKLSEFDFQHNATGRHRDKVIIHKTDFKPAIVKSVSIHSYEEMHDHQ